MQPVLTSILYPFTWLKVALTGAAHDRLICELETAVAERFVGVAGTVWLEVSATENPMGATSEPARRIKTSESPVVFTM